MSFGSIQQCVTVDQGGEENAQHRETNIEHRETIGSQQGVFPDIQ